MNIFPRQFHSAWIIYFLHSLLIVLFLSVSLLFFAIPASSETLYAIRLASYKDKTEAVKRIEELKKLGHNAFIKTVDLQGKGTWHRVYIERFKTRTAAEKEARVFKNLELISEYGIDPIYEGGKKSTGREGGIKLFFLHTSSFQNAGNAVETVERLRAAGQKAIHVKEEVKGRDWYRVYVGEFSSEQSAREAGSALKSKGLITYFKPIEIDRNIIKQGREE